MITSLSIKNFALIEDITINFNEGLTVITGETGSGKSIVIDSIDLLLGARASSSVIRTGEKACVLSASFCTDSKNIKNILSELSIDYDGELIIRRQIECSGKNKTFINDIPVSTNTLSLIGKYLTAFYAQHKSNMLFDKNYQLQIIDNMAGNEKELEELSVKYSALKKLESEKQRIINSGTEKDRMLDLYQYQLNEIRKADLKPGEDEEIEICLPKLKNAEKIQNISYEIADVLYKKNESVLDSMTKITKQIDMLGQYGIDISAISEELQQSVTCIDDIYREIENINRSADVSPEKLNKMLERQQLIKKLKSKYGKTIDDILNYACELEKKVNTLNNYEYNIEKTERQIADVIKEISGICEILSEKRKKVSRVLSKNIEEELKDLNIASAQFEIIINKKDISANGFDDIEFMFNANKGEKLQPLSEVASGGEISRVMLSLACTISKHYNIETLVFDEIDTGTSGKTGDKIGKKMKNLSKTKQVISISHLAQIAANADTHIKIYKETSGDRTYTKSKILNKKEHIEEIANIISGQEITEHAIKHAKELVEN